MPTNTKIFILYTGGTIGMAPHEDKPGSPLVPKKLDELLKYVPGLGDTGIEIGYGAFDPPLDSSNVGSICPVTELTSGKMALHPTARIFLSSRPATRPMLAKPTRCYGTHGLTRRSSIRRQPACYSISRTTKSLPLTTSALCRQPTMAGIVRTLAESQ